MEPVELESIMRNRGKDGTAENSQSTAGQEQSISQTTEAYNKQIETVKQLERQIESLKIKLSTIPSGALSDKLNAGMDLAVANLERGKRALTDLNAILQAGTTAARLFGVQKEKIATVESSLRSAMTITNGVLTVYESVIKRSSPIHEFLILAKGKLAGANVKLATALGISNVAAKALMGTLSLGLSLAISGLVYVWNKYSEAQEEARRKQEAAREMAQKEADEEERIRLSVAGGIASQLMEYKKLQTQYAALGDDMQKKKKFIKDNQDAFDRLGLSISGVDDAESLLITNESAFLTSLEKRAVAAASMEVAANKYKKAIELLVKADNYKASKEDIIDAEKVADHWLAGQAKRIGYRGNIKELATDEKYAKSSDKQIQFIRREYAAQKKLALQQILDAKKAEFKIDASDESARAQKIIKVGLKLETSADDELKKVNIPIAPDKKNNERPVEDIRFAEYISESDKKLKEQEIALEKDAVARKKLIVEQEYKDEIKRIKETITAIENYKGKNINEADKKKLLADLATQKQNAGTIRDSKNTAIDKEEKEKQEKELNDLLKKYQSFEAKKEEIKNQYEAEAAKITAQNKEGITDAERQQLEDSLAILKQKRAAELKSLDEEEANKVATLLKETDGWKVMTEDASQKSIKDIRNILEQAQQLYDYLEGKEGVKLPEGVTQEQADKLKNNKEFKNNLKETITTKTDDLSKKNPFEGFMLQSGNLFDAFKSGKSEDIQKGIDGLGESFQACTAFLGGMGDSLGQVFGEDVGYAIDQALALGQSVFDVGMGVASIASGDILGGISSVVSGISSIFGMGAKTKAENEKVRRELEAKERKSYLAEFEINELYRQRYEWAKKIGESTLQHLERQGNELKNQSKANASEQDELWAKLIGTQYKAGETYQHGTWFRKAKINTEWESLQGKSWEEIELLAASDKLSEEGMQYYEALKKAKEEGEDLAARQEEYLETMRETFTGTTYDSFVSSIVDGFKAGKRSAEDFADSFEELMKGAVSSSIQMIADEESRKFYEEWAALADDEDGLTEDDIKTLKAKYQELMERITAKGEEAEQITGISVLDDKGSGQNGPEAGAFTTMSQEQGTKLEGLFTSLQDHAISIDDKMTDMSTVMFDSFDTLNRIADNTSCLMGMAADINEMKRDGIKMR